MSAPTDADQRHYAWALRMALAATADNADACRETVAEIDAAEGCWRLIAGGLLVTVERALNSSYEGHGVDWVQRELTAHLDGRCEP